MQLYKSHMNTNYKAIYKIGNNFCVIRVKRKCFSFFFDTFLTYLEIH